MIKIKPFDTLFFRDSKPFTMGEEVWADCVFPPMPSVIYGALRSAYLANHLEYIDRDILDTKRDLSSRLLIKGIYYGLENKFSEEHRLFVPLPLDLVKLKNDKVKVSHLTRMTKLDGIIYNHKTEYVLASQNNVESINNGIISLESLKRYLQGAKEINYTTFDEHIVFEPKIGIARDNTKTSKEGMLYCINMIRPNNLIYIVDYEGIDLPNRGFLKLGGQGKPSYYEYFNNDTTLNMEIFNNNEKYFKLYLLTPGLFSNGWLPKYIDEDSKIMKKGKVKAQLMTAAIGKPKYISGFDLKNNRPKSMLKSVPEGSVFYFKLLEGCIKDVMEEFNFQSLCDMGNAYKSRGFGITIVGRINL